MASIRVQHTIGDLESDLRKIRNSKGEMAKIVRSNVFKGQTIARRIARANSGPHGALYYKRITAEMLSPREGEFGPTGDVVGNAVGAGWRHGVNTDLPKAADIIGPQFAKDVADFADDLFWPS